MIEYSQIPDVTGLNALERLKAHQTAARKWFPYLTAGEKLFLFFLMDKSVGFGKNYVCGSIERFAKGVNADGTPSSTGPAPSSVRTMYTALKGLRGKGLVAVDHRESTKKLVKKSRGPGRPVGAWYSVYKINLDWKPEDYGVLPIPKRKLTAHQLAQKARKSFWVEQDSQPIDNKDENAHGSLDIFSAKNDAEDPQKGGVFTANYPPQLIESKKDKNLIESQARERAGGEEKEFQDSGSLAGNTTGAVATGATAPEDLAGFVPLVRDKKAVDIITDLVTRRQALRRSRPKTTRGAWEEAWTATYPGTICPPFTNREIAMLKREEARLQKAGIDWHSYLTYCVSHWGPIMGRAFQKMKAAPAFPAVGFLVRFAPSFVDRYLNDKSVDGHIETLGLTPAGKTAVREAAMALRNGLSLEEAVLHMVTASVETPLTKSLLEKQEQIKQREAAVRIGEKRIVAPGVSHRFVEPEKPAVTHLNAEDAYRFEHPELDAAEEVFGEWKDD